MESKVLSIILEWIHLLAATAWIGGMLVNIFVYLPGMGKVLEPPVMGKLIAAVMKRFRILVYTSIVLFLVSGMASGMIMGSSESNGEADPISVLFIIKISVFLLMVILAVYAFEFLAPKAAAVGAKGPSPQLARMQRTQKIMAMTGLALGIIILAISAAL